jgi:hypothetical protein
MYQVQSTWYQDPLGAEFNSKCESLPARLYIMPKRVFILFGEVFGNLKQHKY